MSTTKHYWGMGMADYNHIRAYKVIIYRRKMGYLKDKKCQSCGSDYMGTASSKYCLTCKVDIMDEQKKHYSIKWRGRHESL